MSVLSSFAGVAAPRRGNRYRLLRRGVGQSFIQRYHSPASSDSDFRRSRGGLPRIERMMASVLETARLVLRPFADAIEDARLLFELDRDPEVMRHIGPYALPTVEAYREKIR